MVLFDHLACAFISEKTRGKPGCFQGVFGFLDPTIYSICLASSELRETRCSTGGASDPALARRLGRSALDLHGTWRAWCRVLLRRACVSISRRLMTSPEPPGSVPFSLCSRERHGVVVNDAEQKRLAEARPALGGVAAKPRWQSAGERSGNPELLA